MTKPRIKKDFLILTLAAIALGLIVWKLAPVAARGESGGAPAAVTGFFVLVTGVLLRMSARGYKKLHSDAGHQLVTEGPYALVRNPMYIGTLMIGCGLLLVVLPVWCVVIFFVVFYLRFRLEIRKEEAHLLAMFGERYARYCLEVPRLIPSWRSLRRVRMQEVFVWRCLFVTHERRGLVGLPVLALVLQICAEKLTHGSVFLGRDLAVFAVNVVVLAGLLLLLRTFSADRPAV